MDSLSSRLVNYLSNPNIYAGYARSTIRSLHLLVYLPKFNTVCALRA